MKKKLYFQTYGVLSAFDHAEMNEIFSYVTYKREKP